MKDKKNKNQEDPEIYAIKKNKEGTTFSRKEFLGTIGAIGAGLAINPLEAFADKIHNTGEDMSAFKAHSDVVKSVSYSSDGKILASGSEDDTIKLWSIPDGKLLKTLKGHTKAVIDVCFSPDGKILASGSWDHNIKLWSIPGGEHLKTLKGHVESVYSISFSPDGKMLASCSKDESITLWSIPNGKPVKTFSGHKDSINSVCFSPYGKILATSSSDQIIKLWSIPELNLLKTLTLAEVGLAKYSPDGKILAAITKMKHYGYDTIALWSIPDGKLLKKLDVVGVKSFCFSPNGKMLISGSGGSYSYQDIKLWSIPDGRLLNSKKIKVESLCISPDGENLAIGYDSKSLMILSMPDLEQSYIFFDPSITKKTKARKVKQMGSVTQTIPCGSPIPARAICICDCIASSRTYPDTKEVCTCNTITIPVGSKLTTNMTCICNTITVGKYSYTSPRSGKGGGSRTYYRTSYSTYWYPN